MRLLIAEDDRALGLFLSRGLEADGHRVHVAYDGAAAVEAFRAEMPDLTILDLNMPVKDGEQVLEEAEAQTERLRKWVCGNYTVTGKHGALKLLVNASIGLAAHAAGDAMKDLLARADAAMYQQKSAAHRKIA